MEIESKINKLRSVNATNNLRFFIESSPMELFIFSIERPLIYNYLIKTFNIK